MTIEEIQAWCRAHRATARGFVRGREFTAGGDKAPAESLKDVLHWELAIEGVKYPTSTSDMEKLVAGTLSIEQFVQVMSRTARRGGEWSKRILSTAFDYQVRQYAARALLTSSGI